MLARGSGSLLFVGGLLGAFPVSVGLSTIAAQCGASDPLQRDLIFGVAGGLWICTGLCVDRIGRDPGRGSRFSTKQRISAWGLVLGGLGLWGAVLL